ncbi:MULTISPECIES: hypothetical protein [Actinomadura]|uniref:hypothetical protein n=1 Tax=Actinomadura TaxID=1988 RepID=UPI001BE455F1|nr:MULTISPECIES: hypothetical protein [Actinomadura]MBT2208709.1 hypothetical protein [Actinomadura sp. NEAU-AAG7]
MAHRKITELANVEFEGRLGEAFQSYGKQLESLANRWKFELGAATTDSRAAMEGLRGHLLLFGLDSRVRARRVAKRLQRAQDLAAGLAEQGEKFHRAYRRQFSDAAHREDVEKAIEDAEKDAEAAEE